MGLLTTERGKEQVILATVPTILRVGPYRFFFYSADSGEPPHVHVERERNRAKFWLEQVRMAENRGFNRAESNRLRKLIEQNRARFLEEWHAFFGN